MSELRWILLVAGVALIAGMYFWGTRGRRRSPPPERPLRFDSKATAPAPTEPSRLEPLVSLRDDFAPLQDEGAGGTVLIEQVPSSGLPPAVARREPTLGPRVEPAPAARRPAPPPADTEPSAEPTVRLASAARPTPPPKPPPAAAPAEKPAAPQKAPQKIVAIRVNATPPGRLDGARLRDALQAEGLEFGRYQIFHRLHGDGRPVFSVASLREPGTFEPDAMAGATYPGIALFAVLPGPVAGVEAFDQLVFTARALAAQLEAALADDRGAPLTVHRIGRLREEVIEFERDRAGAGTP